MVMADLELRLEAAAGQPGTPPSSETAAVPLDTGIAI
jgi:hypothetical protein